MSTGETGGGGIHGLPARANVFRRIPNISAGSHCSLFCAMLSSRRAVSCAICGGRWVRPLEPAHMNDETPQYQTRIENIRTQAEHCQGADAKEFCRQLSNGVVREIQLQPMRQKLGGRLL